MPPQTPAETPHFDLHASSHVGLRRSINEDHYLTAALRREFDVIDTSLEGRRGGEGPDGVLLSVADGVGGNGDGREASEVALTEFRAAMEEFVPWNASPRHETDSDFVTALQDAVRRCSLTVSALTDNDGRARATTLTAAVIFWPDVYVIHVGDSRCYRLRDGELLQMTDDHTVAQEFVKRGFLTTGEAQQSRYKSVLWNSLGGRENRIQPQIVRTRLKPGDALLLCTDGLTRHLPDSDLARIAGMDVDSETACNELIRTANERGGRDNTTAALVRFQDGPRARVADGGPERGHARAEAQIPGRRAPQPAGLRSAFH